MGKETASQFVLDKSCKWTTSGEVGNAPALRIWSKACRKHSDNVTYYRVADVPDVCSCGKPVVTEFQDDFV